MQFILKSILYVKKSENFKKRDNYSFYTEAVISFKFIKSYIYLLKWPASGWITRIYMSPTRTAVGPGSVNTDFLTFE